MFGLCAHQQGPRLWNKVRQVGSNITRYLLVRSCMCTDLLTYLHTCIASYLHVYLPTYVHTVIQSLCIYIERYRERVQTLAYYVLVCGYVCPLLSLQIGHRYPDGIIVIIIISSSNSSSVFVIVIVGVIFISITRA